MLAFPCFLAVLLKAHDLGLVKLTTLSFILGDVNEKQEHIKSIFGMVVTPEVSEV